MSGRWAQLSYASFDDGQSAGGWQVKELLGDVTDAERELLMKFIVPTFPSHVRPAQFLDEQQQRELPQGYAYHRIDAARAVYRRAVQAGTDSTGRPGNVFSHVLLDRSSGQATVRPIELWRSREFPSPFGAGAVIAARLSHPFRAESGPVVTAESVIEFAGSLANYALVPVLLDAVREAMAGGRRVVLLTDHEDRAAQWIGLATRFMAPQRAREVHFSLYERSSGLASAFDAGIHIAAVPTVDLESVRELPGIILVRDGESPPGVGVVGGEPHRLTSGAEVSASDWSELVHMLIAELELAPTVLAELDRLGPEAGSESLEWCLAASILLVEGHVEGEFRERANRLMAAGSGVAVLRDARLQNLSRRAVSHTSGTTAQEAWSELVRASGSPAEVRGDSLLYGVYLERAIADPAWLAAGAETPVASGDMIPDDSQGTLGLIVQNTLVEIGRQYPEEAPAEPTLDLVEFLVRSRVVDVPGAAERLHQLLVVRLQWDVVTLIASHPGDPAVIIGLRDRIRRLHARTRRDFLLEALSIWPETEELDLRLGVTIVGDEGPVPLLDDLVDRVAARETLPANTPGRALLPAYAISLLALGYRRAGLAAIAWRATDPASPATPAEFRDYRPGLLRAELWSVDEVLSVERRAAGGTLLELGTELVFAVIMREPWSGPLLQLTNFVHDRVSHVPVRFDPAESARLSYAIRVRELAEQLRRGVPWPYSETVDLPSPERVVISLTSLGPQHYSWLDLGALYLAAEFAHGIEHPGSTRSLHRAHIEAAAAGTEAAVVVDILAGRYSHRRFAVNAAWRALHWWVLTRPEADAVAQLVVQSRRPSQVERWLAEFGAVGTSGETLLDAITERLLGAVVGPAEDPRAQLARFFTVEHFKQKLNRSAEWSSREWKEVDKLLRPAQKHWEERLLPKRSGLMSNFPAFGARTQADPRGEL